jgi:hypothetical protein
MGIPVAEVEGHLCEEERWLDFQIERLTPEIASFEGQWSAWLRTPRGAFEAFYAETRRS